MSNFYRILKQRRNIFYIVIMVFCYISLLVLYPVFGTDAFKITLIPVIFGSLFFGFKVGILSMLLIDIFLFGYLHYIGITFNSYISVYVTGQIIQVLVVVMFSTLAKMNTRIVTLNEDLKQSSLNDSLPGLHNRRYYSEVVTEMISNFTEEVTNSHVWKREPNIRNKVMGICMIDIDHFKKINDEFGHKAGDVVLQEVSTIMKSLLRFDDIVIRWGGEEFVILLNRTQIEYIPEFLKLLKTSISNRPISVGKDQSVKITVSGGCMVYPFYKDNPGQLSFEESLEIADMLLYHAKKTGRNRLIMPNRFDTPLRYDQFKTMLNAIDKEESQIIKQNLEIV